MMSFSEVLCFVFGVSFLSISARQQGSSQILWWKYLGLLSGWQCEGGTSWSIRGTVYSLCGKVLPRFGNNLGSFRDSNNRLLIPRTLFSAPANREPAETNTATCQVSQHFFALHLATTQDTLTMLQAMQRASVATDPNNPQVPKGVATGMSRRWSFTMFWRAMFRNAVGNVRNEKVMGIVNDWFV